MAYRICGDISDELKFILDCGVSGPPIVEDWKRANAYACRYQDENVILSAQVQRFNDEIRQLRAVLRDMEIKADTWKDMYTMAQNANSLRQDALDALL